MSHNKNHGHTIGGDSLTYRSWKSVKWRCTTPTCKNFEYYNGKLCAQWYCFANFLADMGERPSQQHSIDRYPDNNGNYEPGNCRRATKQQQCDNRNCSIYVEYKGEKILMSKLASLFNLTPQLLHNRIIRR